MAKVTVVENVLKANDQIAAQNQRTLDEQRTVAVNLMASPGAGKTSLLMRTVETLRGRLRIGAIEGDTASQVDADKVATTGTPVIQINTGGGCRLDANMVRPALEQLPLDEIDLLLIENVGNLVCPAAFDLGESLRVVLLSVTEGEDKPLKYPALFHSADVVVVSKVDLAAACDFDGLQARHHIARVAPHARIVEVSARTGAGIAGLLDALGLERMPASV